MILDRLEQPLNYAGINWPAHGVAMIPEGLQYQSIASIVSKVKGLGMNVVRLTYAIEMIDDIYRRGGKDVLLLESLVKALGMGNGTKVYNDVVSWNPDLGGKDITRLDVFNAVAIELAERSVYLHLDNHVSNAGWCCSLDDGNGWFEDRFFNTSNWIRGLTYMAQHARNWTAFTSISLRNELRHSPESPDVNGTYKWSTWYEHMLPAADAVHKANPDPLIFISGLDFDTTLEPVPPATDLNQLTIKIPIDIEKTTDSRTGPHEEVLIPNRNHHNTTKKPKKSFRLEHLAYKDKVVFELHNYQLDTTNCTKLREKLWRSGYNAMVSNPHHPRRHTITATTIGQSIISSSGMNDGITKTHRNLKSSNITNIAPVILTEFGFPHDNESYNSTYAQCLKTFLKDFQGGWMHWVIAGSYYERQGILDYDEGWGLLSHDWKSYRSESVVEEYWRGFVDATVGERTESSRMSNNGREPDSISEEL